jgi:hypothetical protein
MNIDGHRQVCSVIESSWPDNVDIEAVLRNRIADLVAAIADAVFRICGSFYGAVP